MTTGYDLGGVLSAAALDPDGPAIQPCTSCGQPLPGHLTVCPALAAPSLPAGDLAQVEDEEKKLGEAI